MSYRTFSLTINVLMGLLMVAFGLPLMRHKVPPNSFYGFRVRKTWEDPQVWYDANAFAGRCMIWHGISASLASLVLYFIPAINPIVYTWACQLIWLTGLFTGMFLSFRYIN